MQDNHGFLDGLGYEFGHDAEPVITADDHYGDRVIGPAMTDTTGCGHPDTAVTTGDDQSMLFYTDSDADGVADSRVRITEDGWFTVAQHIGPHEWLTTDQGHYGPDEGHVQLGGKPPSADHEEGRDPITGELVFFV